MNLLINTREEYDTLCRILDRKNIKYRVKNFELNVEVDENSAEYADEYAHERKEGISPDSATPTFNELFFEAIRKLENGKCFFFGKYQGEPIEWIKVSKYRAISAYILDNMAFGENNNYAKSKMKQWCNDLGSEYGVNQDGIYIPSEKEIIRWFHADESRKCDYSAEAQVRGIDDGSPWYWLRNAIQGSSSLVRVVHSSGTFGAYGTDNSDVGVRPVLKI